MRTKLALLLLIGVAAACDTGTEADVREEAKPFVERASWSAAAVPVGTGNVRATVTAKEYFGSRADVTANLTGGAPNTAYQWRIFRGDCSVTTAAVNNSSPTGLLLVSTIQSYTDLTTNAAGQATVSRNIVAVLDSLTAYSVRVRVGQSSTNWNGTSPIACGNLQRQ